MTDKMKPTLDDVCADPTLLDSMTLGDMLALTGMELEIEDTQNPVHNARLTELANAFIPDKNLQ